MCGIAGFSGHRSRPLLEAMTTMLAHRGPDAAGYLETDGASLGMRRLKIIDFVSGDQPMTSADGRVHLVYNGEVYNFRELRQELERLGHTFQSQSDGEVVLEAYLEWDTAAFDRFNGMWGLAILDARHDRERLLLCRDHFGIKPLYYARWNGRFVFASEIKAILADPSHPRQVVERTMFEYLAQGLFDHGSETFFEGIHAVPAASYLELDGDEVQIRRYWEPVLAEDGSTDPAAFRALFEQAVARRLVADVRVGTCLSGGLDSSSITVTLAEQLNRANPDASSLGTRLQTFSAVFPYDPIDESRYIDAIVATTHAESHRVAPLPGELLGELERFVWQVEMPMVSSAPFAMWNVMRLASGHVTVLIDGQGGDELLGGYDVYPYVYLRELLRRRQLRHFVTESLRWADVVGPLAASRLRDRLRPTSDLDLLGRAFVRGRRPAADERSRDDLKLRLLQDLTTYSLPPLLRYEDRISMWQSLETRLPFLDKDLVEAVLRLPSSAIIDHGWNRRILREALRGTLPELIYRRRKKIGFTTPEFRWFQREQPALQGILRSGSFRSRPYWDAPAVSEAFRRACEGKRQRSLFFWRVINAEMWLRAYIDTPAFVPALN